MGEINVLILSAGRRVELVNCFQKAAKTLNIKSAIVAADCSDTAAALYLADKACKLPRISEPNYIEAIIGTCLIENVALIVPTIDSDLILLAENRERIEECTGAKVLISDKEVIRICRDKINTQLFLESNDFQIPRMYSVQDINSGNFAFPLFIKPKSGSSSIDTFKVTNMSELENSLNVVEDPIIQDYMEGDEYTIDVFLGFDSNIITVVPRLRIATRSGEISKGKIIKDREIIDEVTKVMKILKPIGHITVQVMKTEKGIEFIEINPRFGGGAPMSIQSGADSCENLFRLLLGEKLEYNEDYRDNLTFIRFDRSICLDEDMNPINY
ncbi:ATP-grasp domain-containing protein [Guptibacillus algicola]|uniref:ATP-grasp domain-containing protein n=1 Tax=Guptibacillus algicola TaxID=225844 RepID=UPI001CD6EE0F|nr:ATP-grasp domain-containing protein [Alkalihalobacillus algicola]MCA0987047.1 ATP-grasp domain-containing protein [Alkalihalobacillus algicola]